MGERDKPDTAEQTAHGGRTKVGTVIRSKRYPFNIIGQPVWVDPPRPAPTFTFWEHPNDTFPMGNIVYFMYSAGRVKIGYSAGLRSRQRSLTSGAPFPPVVLLIMKGSETKERELHKRFAADRLHGEWFGLSPKLRAFLRSRLCDRGLTSLETAEASFKDYCAAFQQGYKPPPKRAPRPTCDHGKPLHHRCYPCERDRDLKTLERLEANNPDQNLGSPFALRSGVRL